MIRPRSASCSVLAVTFPHPRSRTQRHETTSRVARRAPRNAAPGGGRGPPRAGGPHPATAHGRGGGGLQRLVVRISRLGRHDPKDAPRVAAGQPGGRRLPPPVPQLQRGAPSYPGTDRVDGVRGITLRRVREGGRDRRPEPLVRGAAFAFAPGLADDRGKPGALRAGTRPRQDAVERLALLSKPVPSGPPRIRPHRPRRALAADPAGAVSGGGDDRASSHPLHHRWFPDHRGRSSLRCCGWHIPNHRRHPG